MLVEIDKTKASVQKGIESAIIRGDKLEELDEKALMLSNESDAFNKSAKRLRRHFCLQQWKMIACIAFIVIILVLTIWLTLDNTNSD